MIKTSSGLEYTVLKEGEGEAPPLGSEIEVHWTGWLPDGKVFGDTRGDDQPAKYRLASDDLISGWVEALSTMKKGEKRRLHVPSNLAYGNAGYGKDVSPNTDLDFEIELVSFAPPGNGK
jgi:FKBP-type peptidyl-prolyl cis-trans isomerase